MMEHVPTVKNLLVAFLWLEPKLPELVGEQNWNQIRDLFYAELSALRNPHNKNDEYMHASRLLKLFEEYPDALAEILLKTDEAAQLRSTIEGVFIENVKDSGLDISHISDFTTIVLHTYPYPFDRTRQIRISKDGLLESKTTKLENLTDEPQKVVRLTFGLILALFGVLPQHPWLLPAALIYWLFQVKEFATKEISETDTSVLWGMIKARNVHNMADEESIAVCTNTERKRLELPVLSEKRISEALSRLENLGCIELVAGAWKLTESFKFE